ncbi:MAG: class I SAM-dependent methyltransferase [Anaeromyxobacter sp.]|nr:class I SAM-dependent methyltransferase [Anaeromyxobacter sp.]
MATRKSLRQRLRERLNNQYERDRFVHAQLAQLPAGTLLLDAGCGSQRYRPACAHLTYRTQDFGAYSRDEKANLGSRKDDSWRYEYGKLDYVGNIWQVAENDATFDVILCTEVFEHIPHPVETLKEFGRLLKPGGTLILTAPSNCLRHQDPYFFFSGFSDRWYQKFLPENGFEIQLLEPVGDYYSWMGVELARTAVTHSLLTKLLLAPAFLFYMLKRKTQLSVDTLCMGYHVVARRS